MTKWTIIFFFLGVNFISFSQDFPCFTEDLKPGIYYGFDEFLYNEPSGIDSMTLEYKARKSKNWIGSDSVWPSYVGNKKLTNSVWGFCDGETAYIYHQIEFFPISIYKDIRKIRFHGYGKFDVNSCVYNERRSRGGIDGGIVGGVICHNIVKNAKIRKTHYQIDTNYGDILNLTVNRTKLKNYEQLGDEDVYLIFYRKKFEEDEKELIYVVNDTLTLSLGSASYDQIKFKTSNKPIQIASADSSFKTIFVDRISGDNKYIELTKKQNDYRVSVKLVDRERGSFNAHRSKNWQEKREKRKLKKSN